MPQVLADLHRRGVTSVMIEGGAATLGAALAAGLWQEARVEQSPVAVGTGIAAPAFTAEPRSAATIDGNVIAVF